LSFTPDGKRWAFKEAGIGKNVELAPDSKRIVALMPFGTSEN
jgi:hypothetical protein